MCNLSVAVIDFPVFPSQKKKGAEAPYPGNDGGLAGMTSPRIIENDDGDDDIDDTTLRESSLGSRINRTMCGISVSHLSRRPFSFCVLIPPLSLTVLR